VIIGHLLTIKGAKGDEAVRRCGVPHPKTIPYKSFLPVPDANQAANQERIESAIISHE
jgi:hypothetical protein